MHRSAGLDALYRDILAEELLRRAAQRDPLAPIEVLGRVPEGLAPEREKGAEPEQGDSVSPETKVQIATTMLADEGIRSETGRDAYRKSVGKLTETDADKRAAIKKAARIKHTPPFMGAAGKGNALLGAGLGAWRIKNADDKARESAIVSGEVGGTLAGALLAAKLGLIGGPYGSALAGGIGGGLLGGDKVEDFYQWVTD